MKSFQPYQKSHLNTYMCLAVYAVQKDLQCRCNYGS
jgi:hypothetical protein